MTDYKTSEYQRKAYQSYVNRLKEDEEKYKEFKQKLKESQKKYYLKNREKILAKYASEREAQKKTSQNEELLNTSF